MELLIENGFDGIADTIGVLMKSAMYIERSRYLHAKPYERNVDRKGYANGYKSKTIHTRVGEVNLAIPQTRGADFYPKSLERGLRSERALKFALAEMYVQGDTRRSSCNADACWAPEENSYCKHVGKTKQRDLSMLHRNG